MADETRTFAPLEVTVGEHHLHRSEHGMITHHIGGKPDLSAGGMRSSLEAFAEEIARLRKLVGPDAAHDEEAPHFVHPKGSAPEA